MGDFVFASGDAMAIPSVVLWSANPTIRKVLKATYPKPIAAPIASPSPKLCSPIPMAIINPMASGLEDAVRLVLEVSFSAE